MPEKPMPEITHYGTGWAEAELIMAIHHEDRATVQHHIRQMLPGERETLRQAALKLYWALDSDRITDSRMPEAAE